MKKKALAVLLAAAMTASFAGCGSSSDSTTTAAETEETTAADGETEAEEEEEVAYFSAFDYEDITKYCKLGEYKDIKVPLIDTSVSDEDVETDLEDKLDEYNSTDPQYEEVTDRAVEDGDVINLDYSGVLDGETDPFDGGTATGQSLTIGSGQFIDGFEDGLIGVMPGEEVALELTFPDDYSSEDLAGKAVTFTCTVNYIQGDQIMWELNDEFVNAYTEGEYTTLDDYKAYDKEYLEEVNVSDAEDTDINYYWDIVMDNAEYPEEPTELIEYIEYDQKTQLEESLAMYGYDMESYLDMIGETEEELLEELHTYAEEQAKNMVTICAVIRAEESELSEDEMQEALEDLAESVSATLEDLEGYYSEDYLEDVVYQQNMRQWILDNMVVSDEVETEAETTAAAE